MLGILLAITGGLVLSVANCPLFFLVQRWGA